MNHSTRTIRTFIKTRIKKSSVIISTHYYVYSASQALRDFLRINGCSNLLYISHPLPIQDAHREDRSFYEMSHGERILKRGETGRRFTSLLLSSLYETYLTFVWILSSGRHYDFFIAVDNLNALHAILLKWLGKVDRVIYYTIDRFPKRFENRIFNWLYFQLDKLCVRYADETWNVSPQMQIAREEIMGMKGAPYKSQYTVPIGIWYDQAPRKRFSAIDKKKLIFVGHLVAHMGVDLVVQAMPEIVKKVPGATLDIIGGGDEYKSLQVLTRSLKLTDVIKFHGWVRNRERLEKLLSVGAVGLATFNTDILDEKVRNADPGKIKDYMQMGLPVIATDALLNGPEIADAKAGIIIPYNREALVQAIISLLKDDHVLQTYRENALRYVQRFDYHILFEKNLTRFYEHRL